MFQQTLPVLGCIAVVLGRSINLEHSTADPGQVSTYMNPILPGWHSDPSCIFVPEWNNVFFCTTSTFLAYPGIPIYASRDLVSWRLISHALNRPNQVPGLAFAKEQSDGIYASTLRFHNGTFYLATAFLSGYNIPQILLFSTTNPFDHSAWRDPVNVPVNNYGYDPDLFWDEEGLLYVTFAAYNTTDNTEIIMATFDMDTGMSGPWSTIWADTGAAWPEGPHIYKKDGLYYLLIAEGGTGLNHSIAVARSTSITGPYRSYPENPILTAKNTSSYFQTVGHADLFQDGSGNWWGVALATRSGPPWKTYPMGRETVLYPTAWELGDWPRLTAVDGLMRGPLPRTDPMPPCDGPLVAEGDFLDFASVSKLPKHLLTWRPQPESLFTLSPGERRDTLRINSSQANLTGANNFTAGIDSQAFLSRLQSSTLFVFAVDILFQCTVEDSEAGISVFLTQFQHIDLGIVPLRASDGNLRPHFRFRAETSGLPGTKTPRTNIQPIPSSWIGQPITLRVSAPDDETYIFTASSASQKKERLEMGAVKGEIVSGGTGKFTGTLLGSYVTTNGGNNNTHAYLSSWEYQPKAQKIGPGQYVRLYE